jgi:hypothetical protein
MKIVGNDLVTESRENIFELFHHTTAPLTPLPLMHSRQDFDDQMGARYNAHQHDEHEYDSANDSDDSVGTVCASFFS